MALSDRTMYLEGGRTDGRANGKPSVCWWCSTSVVPGIFDTSGLIEEYIVHSFCGFLLAAWLAGWSLSHQMANEVLPQQRQCIRDCLFVVVPPSSRVAAWPEGYESICGWSLCSVHSPPIKWELIFSNDIMRLPRQQGKAPSPKEDPNPHWLLTSHRVTPKSSSNLFVPLENWKFYAPN